MILEEEAGNFDIFKDCLSSTVIQRLAPASGKTSRRRKVKGRKNEIKPVKRVAQDGVEETSDAADLADFIEYLAEEIFFSLPDELRTLSYGAVQDNGELGSKYGTLDSSMMEGLTKSLPLAVSDSLSSYGLMEDRTDLERFLEPACSAYVTSVTAPPPEYAPAVTASRPAGCEICSREHLPLTYHHLIPKEMHAKVVKRGWHREWELNKVAWLCRACHSFVHRIASNEELAKELYSVDLLLEREDVQKWATWVSRVRWKAR